MNRKQIENAIYEMDYWLTINGDGLPEAQTIHLMEMFPKMNEMAKHKDAETTEKLMRWVGFMQGALWAHGFFTVDHFRAMNTK